MRYSPGGTLTVPPPAAATQSMHACIAGVESARPVGSAPASVTTTRSGYATGSPRNWRESPGSSQLP